MKLKGDNGFEFEILLKNGKSIDDWIEATVLMRNGSFSGNCATCFTRNELKELYTELLDNRVGRSFSFEAMESVLNMDCSFDVTGNVVCEITCRDHYNSLTCEVTIDHHTMGAFAHSMKKELEAFD